jgi:hypothetical protein
MKSVQKVVIVAITLCAAFSSAFGQSCGDQCRFTFCPTQGPVRLGRPDRPRTNAICDKFNRINVGHVDSTGEAYVERSNGRRTRISQYRPRGLRQNFSPSFWKSYGLEGRRRRERSGVGHETPQRNQANYLSGRCFILPLTAYQVLDRDGNVIGNRRPRNPFFDCVAFTVF